MKQWIEASIRLGLRHDPHITMEVQQLGSLDILLSRWETELPRILDSGQETQAWADWEHLNLIISLSRLWVMGLYESLRTYRQHVRTAEPSRWLPLESVFRDVEDLRMPLTKHEAKSGLGINGVRFAPPFVQDNRTIGWVAPIRSLGGTDLITRRAIADAFLVAALTLVPPPQ